jgi:hypothetical protein
MIKSIEDCTHEELMDRLKLRLAKDLFSGELDHFIRSTVDLSIRWWQAKEERRNIEAKKKVPKNEEVMYSDLSNRAKNCLVGHGLHSAGEVRTYMVYEGKMLGLSPILLLKCIQNCGRRTATEIIQYYDLRGE